MKTFLSWSGEESKAFANALRDWLPLVVHFVEPWVSDADIDAGERWASEVGKELESSNFGIICINRENLNSQWVLFEAGALSRSMQEGRVIPLLLDIEFKDITGPLAQFQAKKFDSKGVWDVVCAINKLGETPIPDTRLKQLFDALWTDLEKAVKAIPKPVKATKASRPQHEVLEELVSSVRGLDARMREATDRAGVPGGRRNRYSRSMQREMIAMSGIEPGNPLRILMLASVFREDLPWLYELCGDLYRHDTTGNTEAAERTRESLARALSAVPFFKFGDDPLMYEAYRELEFIVMSRPLFSNDPARQSTSKVAPNKEKKKADKL